jgi:hypothetical protein
MDSKVREEDIVLKNIGDLPFQVSISRAAVIV